MTVLEIDCETNAVQIREEREDERLLRESAAAEDDERIQLQLSREQKRQETKDIISQWLLSRDDVTPEVADALMRSIG